MPASKNGSFAFGPDTYARALAARDAVDLPLDRLLQIAEADRQKNEFLAMLAHELRNPLAPISNARELLSRTIVSNPQARSALATVDVPNSIINPLTSNRLPEETGVAMSSLLLVVMSSRQ